MNKVIDYYFAPISPFMYLGHQRFVALAARYGASIAIKPIDLGAVFPASGGLPLAKRAPQRQAYRLVELKRWSDFLGVALNTQPKFFPVSGDLAAKSILASQEIGAAQALALIGAVGRALWSEDRNIADPSTIAALAQAQGLDPSHLAARAGSPDIEAHYKSLTQEAIDRQVFGSPTYIYRDQPFWGQDRLDFLELELAK